MFNKKNFTIPVPALGVELVPELKLYSVKDFMGDKKPGLCIYLKDQGEPYCALTVSLGEFIGAKNCTYVDTYNCPADVIEEFVSAGYAKDTGLTKHSGFCVFPLYCFSEDFLKSIGAEEYEEYSKAYEDEGTFQEEYTEICPYCENEVTVIGNSIEDNYQTSCPKCKKRIMLCTECMCDRYFCDWSESKGCCRNKYGIALLKHEFGADVGQTAYGEPQAFIPLANGRVIEACCEQEMLPKEDFFYSVRLHCSEAEEKQYEDSLGVISTQTAKTVSEMNKLIKKLVKQNGGLLKKSQVISNECGYEADGKEFENDE